MYTEKVRFQYFLEVSVVCDRTRVQSCVMNEPNVHGNSSCDCSWDEMSEVYADRRGMKYVHLCASI